MLGLSHPDTKVRCTVMMMRPYLILSLILAPKELTPSSKHGNSCQIGVRSKKNSRPPWSGCVRAHNDGKDPTAALLLQRALQVPRGERRPSLTSTLVSHVFLASHVPFLRLAASLNRRRRCAGHVAVSEHRPQLLQQRGLLRARGLHLSDLLHHVPHGEPDTSIAP